MKREYLTTPRLRGLTQNLCINLRRQVSCPCCRDFSRPALSLCSLKRRRQRGAALVEFALISSFLFLILFGIVEVGLLLGDQAQVGEAAREAARAAAVGSPTITAQTSAANAGASIHLTTANVLLEKSLDGGTTWALLGDTGTGVNDAVSGSLVRATVTYNHPLVTTLIFTGSTRLVTSKMVMQRE